MNTQQSRNLVQALSGLILATWILPATAVADTVGEFNRLRTTGCSTERAITTPLHADARLSAAARRVAGGEPLQAAANAEAYRARRVARINIEHTSPADFALVLQQQFCHIVADPELTDIGVYASSGETWILAAAPLALGEGDSLESAAGKLFVQVNDAREQARSCGLQSFAPAPAMLRSDELDEAARKHALDIATHSAMGHDGSDGSSAGERAEDAGYHWRIVGENVAAGQIAAEEVVDTWLDSDGHCKNLMDPRFSETGIGVALNENDDRVIYWVQVYAAPL
jgi:uncharacterized protein YkwD